MLKLSDVSRYHGHNERISVDNYHQAVNFYYRVIRNADLALSEEYTTRAFSAEL